MHTALKNILRSTYRTVNWILGVVLEPILAFVMPKSRHSETPIFIIGAPRSGTTLTFQLVTYSLNLGYLNNLHCVVYGIPALISLFTRNLPRDEDFCSDHGQTHGWLGPSECGQWWYRFFPRDPVYITRQGVNRRAMKAFSRSLKSIAAAERRPLVFKNLYAGMRLEPIVSEFPDALFVYVTRDLWDNARSILEGRMQTYGSFERWWSVPPPGYEELLSCPAETQVVEQIRMIHGQLEKDIESLSLGPKVIRVDYEKICKAPSAFIEDFEAFLSKADITVKRLASPPLNFTISKKNLLPDEISAKLDRAVNRE